MTKATLALLMLLGACGQPSPRIGCPLPSGRICDLTLGCICDDGCNTCKFFEDCQLVAKSQVGCGSPPLRCTSAADCPQGDRCAYDPGCSAPSGICIWEGPSDHSPTTICDCHGQTVSVEVLDYVTQPYAHVGACR